MGGILEVAGVPGFLGNLKEMYEAADAEGSIWRGFVSLWWDRFGTQQVSTADLYDLALQCSLPLAKGDEHAKRTSLGQALRRMRDRIYTVADRRLRVCHAGSAHGVQRWLLETFGTGKPESSPAGGLGGPLSGSNSPSAGWPPRRPTWKNLGKSMLG
jgi:hypothetical protein